MQRNPSRWYSFLTLSLLLLCAAAMLAPDLAFAQSPPPAVPHGTCTTDPQFVIPSPEPGQGIISSIITNIQTVLGAVSNAMFTEIISDSSFNTAVRALMTLYIVFYGIMFTFGMVQITMYDFSIRMIKIGVVAVLLSPGAWGFFSSTVVTFFNSGTDQWINSVSGAVLNEAVPGNAPPFYVIDRALTKAVSAKMAVTLMAMFFTPPYGPIFGMLLALGMGTFVRAILTAAWVYLMSLILKALLFGVAPIFLSFLLFVRTRYLFNGWLNQIVNATLQPVLLFTFLAFFVQLINVAMDNIFVNPVCWTEWAESLRGSPFSVHYWRFALCNGGACEPYGGTWGFSGPQSANGPIFPIDILGILVLVMLADLCSRFNSIVVLIASDLASASTDLASMQGAAGDFFKQGKRGAQAPQGQSMAGNSALPNQRGGTSDGGAMPGPGGGARRPLGKS